MAGSNSSDAGGQEYPFVERGVGRLHDYLWVHRRLGNQSFFMLADAGETIHPHEAMAKRIGGYSLTVLYPAEIYRALRWSRRKERLSAQDVYDELIPYIPDSAAEPVTATVGDVRQFASSIGVEVAYEGFKSERQAIEAGLSDILKIRYHRESVPHVSFAKGKVSNLTNRDEIEAKLSNMMTLSPMYNGMSTQIKR